LCLHTIFRALIYWAHRAVVLAIAWHLVSMRNYVRFSCSRGDSVAGIVGHLVSILVDT